MPHENNNGGGYGVAPPTHALDNAPTAVNALDFVTAAMQEGLDRGKLGELDVTTIVTLTILQLVTNPEKVKLYVTQAVRSITLEFDVDDADIGKIIGKGGHTIDSIRSLARSVAGESDKSYKISLIEDQLAGASESRAWRQDGGRRPYRRFPNY